MCIAASCRYTRGTHLIVRPNTEVMMMMTDGVDQSPSQGSGRPLHASHLNNHPLKLLDCPCRYNIAAQEIQRQWILSTAGCTRDSCVSAASANLQARATAWGTCTACWLQCMHSPLAPCNACPAMLPLYVSPDSVVCRRQGLIIHWHWLHSLDSVVCRRQGLIIHWH